MNKNASPKTLVKDIELLTYIPHAFAQHEKRRRTKPTVWCGLMVVGWHFLVVYTFAFVGSKEARYLIWQVPLPWESGTKVVHDYATCITLMNLKSLPKIPLEYVRK